jgi:hypothetical protein
VELLALVDPARHAVAGSWSREGEALRCDNQAAARIVLPAAPDGDYQLQVEVVRLSGDEPLWLVIPVGQTQALVLLDGRSEAGETYCGLELIDGKFAAQNDSTEHVAALENGRRHKVEATVNTSGGRARILISLDDEPLFDWAGQTSSLAVGPQLATPDVRLPALVSQRGELRFYGARLKMLSGELRD